MKLVDLIGLHIEATSGAPLVLLREHDAPHRVLPIFVGGPEAASIAVALSGQVSPRPLTHDVMASLVQSLDARVEAVEVTDLRDGAFLAAISVSGPAGEHRLDTRPSDAIALAVRLGTPLFVSNEVLDEAGTVISEEPDEESIDEVVAEFREFLAELDPVAFADAAETDDADQHRGAEDASMPKHDGADGAGDLEA
jgi:bifunctional DNase/RNase